MSGNVSYAKASITAEAALRVVRASVAAAEQIGHPFVIIVVDESGVPKASLRMDGAALLAVQIAQDKAYTAAGFGISTDDWFDFISRDEQLRFAAPSAIDRLVPFGGGFPLVVDGSVVGGLGVSGGLLSQDVQVARAGLAALAHTPKLLP